MGGVIVPAGVAVQAREVATLGLSYNLFPEGFWARLEGVLEGEGRRLTLFVSKNDVGLNALVPEWLSPSEGEVPFYTLVPHGGRVASVIGFVGGVVRFHVVAGPGVREDDMRGFALRITRMHLVPAPKDVVPAELLAFDPDARPAPAAPRGSGMAGRLARHAASVLSHAASYPVGRVRGGW